MSPTGKLLDGQLFKNSGVLAKAMVPLMGVMNDIAAKKDKNLTPYLQAINDSLTMLMAAFNYNNLTRMDVARFYVKDAGLHQLCQDKALEMGEKWLFPEDVTSKCADLMKRRKLGPWKDKSRSQPSDRGRYQGPRRGRGQKRRSRTPYRENPEATPTYRSERQDFLGWNKGRGKYRTK